MECTQDQLRAECADESDTDSEHSDSDGESDTSLDTEDLDLFKPHLPAAVVLQNFPVTRRKGTTRQPE